MDNYEITEQWIWMLEEVLEVVAIAAVVIIAAVLVYRRKVNDTNKRSQIVLTALEKGAGDVPEEVLTSLNPPQKSVKQRLLIKLLWGVIMSLTGLGILITGLILSQNEQVIDVEDAVGLIILGVPLLAVGVAFLAYYFVARKSLRHEIEAEEKELANR